MLTAAGQLRVNFTLVGRRIPIRDESHEGSVLCEYPVFDRMVTRDAALHVQGEEQWG